MRSGCDGAWPCMHAAAQDERSGYDGAWPCTHVAAQGVRSGCDGAWPCTHVAAKVVRSGNDGAWPCMHVAAKGVRSGCDGAWPCMHVAAKVVSSGCDGVWPCMHVAAQGATVRGHARSAGWVVAAPQTRYETSRHGSFARLRTCVIISSPWRVVVVASAASSEAERSTAGRGIRLSSCHRVKRRTNTA